MSTDGRTAGLGPPGASPRTARVAVLLGVLTAAATVPALFGEFIWDDWLLIVQNRRMSPPIDWGALVTTPFWDTSVIRAQEGFGAYPGLHRPFVKLALAVQKSLFASDPFGYHVVNWVLHATNAGLVFAWIHGRLAGGERGPRTAAAAAGALVFALHPTRAESMGWICGSTDTWMTLWALLALLAAERHRPWALGVAAVSAALAAWSKEPVWVLPIVPWLDALASPSSERRWGPTLAIAGGILVAVAFSAPVLLVAADSPAWVSIELGAVPSRALATLGAYVSRLAFPWPPSIRPFPFVVEDGAMVYSPALIALGALTSVAVIAAAVRILRPRHHGRALAELALAVLALMPALNLLPRNFDTLAGDRFLYLPSVGVAALLARGLLAVATRRPETRRALAVLGVAVLGVLAYGTSQALHYLRDDLTLREHEVALHPDDARSQLYLGTVYFNRGRPHDAREGALRGLAAGHGHIAPSDELALVSLLARGYVTTASDADRDTLSAVASYLDGLLAGTDVHLRVSSVRFHRRFDEVAQRWRANHEAQLHVDRGIVALRLGDLERAREELAPHAASAGVGACIALANALARLERFHAALAALAECQTQPEDFAAIEAAKERVARAGLLAAQEAASPRAAALRDAAVALLLSAPQAARDALEPELAQSPADPQLLQARVQADIDDRRLDLAEVVVRRARAAASDPRPYDALLERLEREGAARAAQSPR